MTHEFVITEMAAGRAQPHPLPPLQIWRGGEAYDAWRAGLWGEVAKAAYEPASFSTRGWHCKISGGAWKAGEQDAIRQAFLESLELRVIRFTNDEVMADIDEVVRRIEAAV